MQMLLLPTLSLHTLPPFLDSVLSETQDRLEDPRYAGVVELWEGASPTPSSDYASMTDWLLCTALPGLVPACREFYDNEGPSLVEIYTDDSIAQVDAHLAQALDQALEL